MPLPPEFSEQEHLQSVIRRWMNREIREFFRDADEDEWDEDITTPKGSLRVACNHRDTDSLIMTQLRWLLFERVRLQRIQVPITGIPTGSFQPTRRFKPQVQLYFQEDLEDVDPGFEPVTGEVSFRLMNQDSDTITPAFAQVLATRVRSNFSVGGGYRWRKGRGMLSYTDKRKGYQLQLLCRTENDGRQLVDRVLDVGQDTPDWDKAAYSENLAEGSAYPVIPPTERIYGQIRRLPRRRPIATVRFQYALLHVWGLQNPIPLVDRTGLWPSELAG